jgi:hypothetical protein
MATEDQLSRLKELVANSQKAIQLSNNYSEEANMLYQQCKINCDKLDAAFQKMEVIHREVLKQFQVI